MISADSLRRLYRAPGSAQPPAPERPRFAVVTCMDPRVDVAKALSIPASDLYLLRNAGGRVSPDTIRSLVVAWSEADVTEVIVVHHTDCRVAAFGNGELRTHAAAKLGADVSAVAIDFDPIGDLRGSVAEDVERLRRPRSLPPDLPVSGFVYDVETATVDAVIVDPFSVLATRTRIRS